MPDTTGTIEFFEEKTLFHPDILKTKKAEIIGFYKKYQDDADALERMQSLWAAQDKNGQTPVHLAAREGYADIIRALPLIFKDDVETLKNLCKQQGMVHRHTPLHLAAYFGRVAVIKAIQSIFKDDVLAFQKLWLSKTKQGYTPLHYAAEEGHLGVFELAHSIFKHHITRLQRLCQMKDGHLCTPFDYAAREGHSGIIRNFYFIFECDIDALQKMWDAKKDMYGEVRYTPLYHIAKERDPKMVEVVQSIFESNPEGLRKLWSVRDKTGYTLFHYIVKMGHVEMVNACHSIFKDNPDELHDLWTQQVVESAYNDVEMMRIYLSFCLDTRPKVIQSVSEQVLKKLKEVKYCRIAHDILLPYASEELNASEDFKQYLLLAKKTQDDLYEAIGLPRDVCNVILNMVNLPKIRPQREEDQKKPNKSDRPATP